MATVAITIRLPAERLEEIDRRAGARGMTRTAFILETALDDHYEQTAEEKAFGDFDRRLTRLEHATFGEV
jgi:uncharacterized protein (DUF1778 family)